jgi:hypothetical protein
MSSFNNPHHLYLFAMKNGKKKIAYGSSPEDAYESLKLRLTEKEMDAIIKDQYTRIAQREMQAHVHELG